MLVMHRVASNLKPLPSLVGDMYGTGPSSSSCTPLTPFQPSSCASPAPPPASWLIQLASSLPLGTGDYVVEKLHPLDGEGRVSSMTLAYHRDSLGWEFYRRLNMHWQELRRPQDIPDWVKWAVPLYDSTTCLLQVLEALVGP